MLFGSVWLGVDWFGWVVLGWVFVWFVSQAFNGMLRHWVAHGQMTNHWPLVKNVYVLTVDLDSLSCSRTNVMKNITKKARCQLFFKQFVHFVDDIYLFDTNEM